MQETRASVLEDDGQWRQCPNTCQNNGILECAASRAHKKKPSRQTADFVRHEGKLFVGRMSNLPIGEEATNS